MKNELVKIKEKTSIEQSVEDFAFATVRQSLARAEDIMRDKKRAVNNFFGLVKKEPDEITTADVRDWYLKMLNRHPSLSESYIYTSMSHLSSYFEWLRSMPEFSHFIKVNPVRAIMPKPPKKYNSPKAKALTDGELTKLWNFMENRAKDDSNLIAVRDYAIFRLFMATGMRREEVIDLGMEDLRLEAELLLIHTRVKGGKYEWRTVGDGEVIDALLRYLKLTRRKSLIGQKGRALWIRFDRAATVQNAKRLKENPSSGEPRLSSHSYDKQIKLYALEAGIGDFNIHKFRHTFARIVSEDSGSLIETQDALGHSDIQTTQIYVNSIKFKKDKFSRNIRRRIQTEDSED
jgi:integrase